MNNLQEIPQSPIQFHVLRRGEEEPLGPYSQDQLVEFLNQELIRPFDYVYYPDLPGWQRLSEVFELHQEIPHLGSEGQDPDIVTESYNLVERRSEPDEDIYYVAVQHLPALSLSAAVRLTTPKSIVLTNHRICVISQKLLGETHLSEYPLDQIQRVVPRIKNGHPDGVFEIQLRSGETVEVDKIPFAQLNQLDLMTPELIQQLRGDGGG